MKHSHRVALHVCALAVAALAAAPVAAQGRPDLVSRGLENAALRYAPDQLIVQFKPGVTEAAKQAMLEGLGASVARDLRLAAQRGDGRGDLHLISLPAGSSVAAAFRIAQGDAAVDFAEPNWIHHHDATGVDAHYKDGSLWGMYGDTSKLHQNQYGSQAAEAWITGGNVCSQSVYVGVIDEGVMATHPDLSANMWTNPFDPVNGVDDDGNGYIDDTRGWDFFQNNNSTFDGVGDDHGTHVAGTIGATGNNKIGVVGVCPNVQIITAKFLGPFGGSTADGVLAVDYITDLKTRHGLNIVATNNSWGGGGFSQALQNAITRAGNADILFIAAAGNDGLNNDNSPHYPSSYPNANIIAVANITKTGAREAFSNWGLTTVDLGAPGAGIWSTVPTSGGGSGYASYTGTSMATPHVTGGAALYATTHPSATAAQIKAMILGSAIPTPSMAGKTVTGGRLDVSGF
jgi:subtilisin family serine protease